MPTPTEIEEIFDLIIILHALYEAYIGLPGAVTCLFLWVVIHYFEEKRAA